MRRIYEIAFEGENNCAKEWLVKPYLHNNIFKLVYLRRGQLANLITAISWTLPTWLVTIQGMFMIKMFPASVTNIVNTVHMIQQHTLMMKMFLAQFTSVTGVLAAHECCLHGSIMDVCNRDVFPHTGYNSSSTLHTWTYNSLLQSIWLPHT